MLGICRRPSREAWAQGSRADDRRNGKNGSRRVTHADCTASIVKYIVDNNLRDFVLLGHSYSGTIIAKVAEAIPDRLQRLVFWSAFVLNDGQSLFDETPQNVAISEEGARKSGDDTFLPPFEAVRDVFFNSCTREDAQRYYQRWSPQPMQPFRYKLDMTKFYRLSIPKSYLVCTEDIRIPMPEHSWHPRFSNRLGCSRFVSMPGDHEALFTSPELLAQKLVEAGRP